MCKFKKNLIEKEIESNLEFSQKLIEKNRKLGLEISDKNNGYPAIVTSLKLLFDLSDEEIINNDIVIDAKKDGFIDAVFIDDSIKKIYFLDVKKSDKFERVDILNKLILETIKKNFFNYGKELDGLNPLAKKKISQARELYHKDKEGYSIQIIILRLLYSNKVEDRLMEEIDRNIVGYNKVNIEYLNLDKCSDLLINKKNKNKLNDVFIIFNENNFFFDEKNKVAVGKLEIKTLIDIINSSEVDGYNIFDDNIRINQDDNNFKEDLSETIRENKEKFFLYHNGITISCEKLENRGSTTFKIDNPQIINGCQSVMAIKKIFKENNNDLEDVYILCRLFEAKNIEDVNAVCQTTNTQRKIESWDLRTNDDEQKFIEKAMGYIENINYSRKKKRKSKKNNDILLTEVAQWIHSCKNKKPAEAKSSKTKLFSVVDGKDSIYYEKIFNFDKFEFDKLKNIIENCFFVNLEIEKRIRSNPEDRTFLKNADFHIMTYLYNYGERTIDSFERAVSICKKAHSAMKKIMKDKEYSPNSTFKNKNTWSEIEKINADNKK